MPTAADVIAGKARWSAEQSDALEWLRSLPDGCARMCVTSPPYYGLRDYGTAKWEGGDAECDHKAQAAPRSARPAGGLEGGKATVDAGTVQRGNCHRCGARRVDAQIGLEPTPAEYVAKLVAVFREVRRVLTDDGTLWLNLGDSYASTPAGCGAEGVSRSSTLKGITTGSGAYWETLKAGHGQKRDTSKIPGIKPKDLLGIPWMVAFALREDGWYLRQDIIWHKLNPMPESVTDRCTKAHEYLFLLSKSARYFYDADAIAEASVDPPGTHRGGSLLRAATQGNGDKLVSAQNHGGGIESLLSDGWRNRRSVWSIATKPYKGAHFATFPPDLITPCILAGSAPDDIVIEPFSGSGTTLAVAVDKGRRAIGCELNPAYCRLIERRLRKVTPPLFTEAV